MAPKLPSLLNNPKNGYYAIQGHLWSPLSVPIKSLYATSYVQITVTHILSHAISKTMQQATNSGLQNVASN